MRIARVIRARLTLLSGSKLDVKCMYINYVAKNSKVDRFAYIDTKKRELGRLPLDIALLKRAILLDLRVDLLIERRKCPQKKDRDTDYLIAVTQSDTE